MTSFVAKTFLPRSSCHDLPAKEDLPAKTFPGDPDHHDKTSFVAACHHRSDGDAICKHAVARANRAIGCGTGQGRAWSRRETQAAAEGSTAEGSSAARSPGTSGWSTSTSCAACSRPATSPGPAAACSGTSTATHASTTTDASSGSTGASHTSGSPRCSATPGGAETSNSAGRKAGRTASAEKRASANGAASGARERAREGKTSDNTAAPCRRSGTCAGNASGRSPTTDSPSGHAADADCARHTSTTRPATERRGSGSTGRGSCRSRAAACRRTVRAPCATHGDRAASGRACARRGADPDCSGRGPGGAAPHGGFPWRAAGKRSGRPQGLHRTRPGHRGRSLLASRSSVTTKKTDSASARVTSRPGRSAAKPVPSCFVPTARRSSLSLTATASCCGGFAGIGRAARSSSSTTATAIPTRSAASMSTCRRQ